MTVKAQRAAGTLALVGGGEFDAPLRALDARLLEAAGARDVVVLATAAAFEQPDDVVKRAVTHFESLDATVRDVPVLTRRDAEDDQLVKAVKGARFIYLSDGSPLHLRSVLKDTSLLAVLLAAWRSGSVLAASGAGATVLCDPMVDPRGGAYTVGLGLVDGLAVFPHHTSAPDHLWDRSRELLPKTAVLAGIDDHTALVRDPHGAWDVVGAGVVALYHNGEVTRCPPGPCPALS
jgi:cyanophycinase